MSFKPQLCSPYEEAGDLRFPTWASYKLDGIRCVTRYGNTLARSLKPIPNHHIRDTLSEFQDLDGEIIVGAPNLETTYRTTNSATMSHDGEPDFTYWVFDDLSDLSLTFEHRMDKLRNRKLPDFIKVLPQTQLTHASMLMPVYGKAVEDGYEGLILRNPQSMYKFGRCTAKSQDALKVKPVADSEAVIVSVYEAMSNQNAAFKNELGQTERSTEQAGLVPAGMIGGFVARDIHTGVEFDCAPGKMTHDERISLWEAQRGALAGKILRYRFFPYGQKDKPRFPRWIGWRDKIDM